MRLTQTRGLQRRHTLQYFDVSKLNCSMPSPSNLPTIWSIYTIVLKLIVDMVVEFSISQSNLCPACHIPFWLSALPRGGSGRGHALGGAVRWLRPRRGRGHGPLPLLGLSQRTSMHYRHLCRHKVLKTAASKRQFCGSFQETVLW